MLVATGISLVLFFVLKDLGPALVTLFVFLAMFTVARGRPALAIAALVLMVAAVAIGYRAGTPHTVVQRIDMWLLAWDNDVHGGDQLAHALWAFATGGATGSGPGWGDPGVIPAGNTDLVLPAIGEEWGFAGVAAVFALFGFLIWRGLRAAQRADTTYGLFLATGLATLIACEMLLITAGVLGRCRSPAWCRRFSVRATPRWWRISWCSRCWRASAIPKRHTQPEALRAPVRPSEVRAGRRRR